MTHVSTVGMKLPMYISGGGSTIVLLHGRGADHRTWAGFALAFHEYRVVTVDLVGHGLADCPEGEDPYSITAQAEDVWETLGDIKTPFALLGHSMGGMVALHMALSRPEAISSLILASTAARPPHLSDSRAHVQLVYQGMADLAVSEGMAKVCEHYDQVIAPLDDKGRAMLMSFKPHVFAASIRAGAGMEDYEERLSALEVPTLVMAGEKDLVFVDEARRMVELLPKSGFCLVPDAGHGIYREQTHLVSQRVLQFLRRNPPRKHGAA